MSHPEPSPSTDTPQDAPLGSSWDPAATGAAQPWPPPPESPGSDPARPHRRVIPAPTGPNWTLTAFGLVLVAASLALAGYLLGYPAVDVAAWGPRSMSILGAVLVAVGVVGLLTRRRR